MPSKDEVIEKASSYIDYSIQKYASHFPVETKEDIKQDAFERVLKAYERIEEDRGHWKSFIQSHCNGAVLDYVKNKKNTRHDNEYIESVDILDCDNLTNYGIFFQSEKDTNLNINWDLVSRMASKDYKILLVARFILGYTISDISKNSSVSRETLTQSLKEFCESLDDPFNLGDGWVEQTIYAFGLSERFMQKESDNGIGWDLEPIDIYAKDLRVRKLKVNINQMELI